MGGLDFAGAVCLAVVFLDAVLDGLFVFFFLDLVEAAPTNAPAEAAATPVTAAAFTDFAGLADAPSLVAIASCETECSGTGSPRSCTPSRSSTPSAPCGKSLRNRKNPRARIGSRGISSTQSSSRNCARDKAAEATSGSYSARCAASSGLRKRQLSSRTIAARSFAGIVSPNAPSLSQAAATKLSSWPYLSLPRISSSWRYCVRADASPVARCLSTVARRSSKNMVNGRFLAGQAGAFWRPFAVSASRVRPIAGFTCVAKRDNCCHT